MPADHTKLQLNDHLLTREEPLHWPPKSRISPLHSTLAPQHLNSKWQGGVSLAKCLKQQVYVGGVGDAGEVAYSRPRGLHSFYSFFFFFSSAKMPQCRLLSWGPCRRHVGINNRRMCACRTWSVFGQHSSGDAGGTNLELNI